AATRMPTSLVVSCTSRTSSGTSGGTTAKNADSAAKTEPTKTASRLDVVGTLSTQIERSIQRGRASDQHLARSREDCGHPEGAVDQTVEHAMLGGHTGLLQAQYISVRLLTQRVEAARKNHRRGHATKVGRAQR